MADVVHIDQVNARGQDVLDIVVEALQDAGATITDAQVDQLRGRRELMSQIINAARVRPLSSILPDEEDTRG